MKNQGEIASILGRLGFIKLADDSRISFDYEQDSDLKPFDLVSFIIKEVPGSNTNSMYFKAFDISLLERPEITPQSKLLRLSKVAKTHNISLGKITTLLQSKGIKIESNPNAKLDEEQYATFLEALTDFDDELDFRTTFKRKYSRGTIVELKIDAIIAPSQVITYFTDDFQGRLSLLDIDWSFPESQKSFASLEVGQNIRCCILSIDFESKQVILGQKQLKKQLSGTGQWARIERGDQFKCELVEELKDFYLVRASSNEFGLLSKGFTESTQGLMKLKVQSKSDENDLLYFTPASLDVIVQEEGILELPNEFSFVEPDLQDFYSFKKSIIGRHATNSQIEFIRDAFEQFPNIFAKDFELSQTIYLAFELKHQSWEFQFKQNAIAYFYPDEELSKELEVNLLKKLETESYWVRFNKRKKKETGNEEGIFFSFFNEDINIYGEVLQSNGGRDTKFAIRDFTCGQAVSRSTDAKKRNSKNGAFLFKAPLKVTSPFGVLPSGDSQSQILKAILLKNDCLHIVKALKQEAGEILRQEGRTLAIIDKFLEYQESLIESSKAPAIFVNKFEQTHSPEGGISIVLEKTIADSLELEDESQVIIRVKHPKEDEIVKYSDGTLVLQGDKCKLSFRNDVRTENLKNGFYIEKKISKRQIQIQREIIQDFLQKKINIDHIESLLVEPEKIKSPVISKNELISKDLIATEKDQPNNNQIKAVRKAIGNHNIFLIQGPPGTGKTTVISEIIQQLVAKNKKILVAGQNHVAVDNVLAKISKLSHLNLLRVGNIEKIDEELSRFHIDSRVDDYKAVFGDFLKNQLSLLKMLLDYHERNFSEDQISQEYNKRVNEYCAEYSALNASLKHRHFILRQGLKSLTVNELKSIVIKYEEWVINTHAEVETLLRPIIYNSLDVVFSTCIGIKTDSVFRNTDFKFDVVIIDEAGKANIAETLVAIELGKTVILVGDQMQLPPYMDNSLIDENSPGSFPKSEYGYEFTQEEILHALKTSFFEFLIKRIETGGFPKDNMEMLNFQHRMHPHIGEFVSKSFYGGNVQMGARTHLNKLSLPAPFNNEVIFFDTSNCPNPFEQTDGYSAKNNTEAEAIAELILPALFDGQVSSEEIAIIAPYKSQVANIQKYIKESQTCRYRNIDVSTLDSFQGKEYDIIIFGFTRSSDHRKAPMINGRKKFSKVGFLDDARRLNVAFSRAKKKLILVGNATTLVDRRSHYDIIFNYTELFQRLVDLSKDEKVGSFLKIADYYDFRNPFDRFSEKFRIGNPLKAVFHSVGVRDNIQYGVFFIVEGCRCLLPVSMIPANRRSEFFSLAVGTEMQLLLFSKDIKAKRITLCISAANLNMSDIKQFKVNLWNEYANELKENAIISCKVTKQESFGFFLEMTNGITGLLPNQYAKNKGLKLGETIEVVIEQINNLKKQISFKLR